MSAEQYSHLINFIGAALALQALGNGIYFLLIMRKLTRGARR